MPAVVSNHIEVSTFCHATRAPAVDSVKSTMAIGRAMIDVLDALQGLEDRLAEDPRFGADKVAEIVSPLMEATDQVWNGVDEGLLRKSARAA